MIHRKKGATLELETSIFGDIVGRDILREALFFFLLLQLLPDDCY